jgi:hypothetical protein
MVAGLCACILPGIYLYAVFMVLPAVVLFEREVPISRCFRLFHRGFSTAIGRVATIFGIIVGVSLAGTAIGAVIGGVAGTTNATVDLGSPAQIGISLVTAAIAAVLSGAAYLVVNPLLLVTYADVRARVEPFATQMLVQGTVVPTTAYEYPPNAGWQGPA